MPKSEIKHPDKKASTGAYSAGVLIDGWLYISGQGPLDLKTGEVVRGTIEQETRLTMEHIGMILEATGFGFEDVVKCTCHLADIRDFDAFNRVYSEFFQGVLPARTTVQSGLGDGIKVEIDAVARRSGDHAMSTQEPGAVTAGVAGLGLMGTSIVAALLAAGHRVIGLTRSLARRSNAREIVLERLVEMRESGVLRGDPSAIIGRLQITEDYRDLIGCRVVIESIIEDLPAKKEALAKIEAVVAADALIGSNTSAIPVSILQAGTLHPERILGIHWAEPAHVTRFMEIICGERTTPENADWAVRLARAWGKEPTLVRRDIRGFITNRLMYAMLREAFYLVENGYATPADVDRSARNDMGFWMTLAGPFRFMDLTGIPAYRNVMKDLFPELCNSSECPKLMQDVVDSGARGVSNARGFYSYTPEQAKRWEALFLKFTYDIRALALRYPEDVGD